MSLQSRTFRFWQILNTRVCRTFHLFTTFFSDNKFYFPHKKLFKPYPGTSWLRKLLASATRQYLPHYKQQDSVYHTKPISTASRWMTLHTYWEILFETSGTCCPFECSVCVDQLKMKKPSFWTSKQILCGSINGHRHQCGSGTTSSKDDRSFNCLHGKNTPLFNNPWIRV